MSDLKTDILIVGGGPGGFMTSVTAATNWPDKKITVVRPEEKALIPCGIPYIFGTLSDIEEDLFFGPREFRATGANLLIDRVASSLVHILGSVARSIPSSQPLTTHWRTECREHFEST